MRVPRLCSESAGSAARTEPGRVLERHVNTLACLQLRLARMRQFANLAHPRWSVRAARGVALQQLGSTKVWPPGTRAYQAADAIASRARGTEGLSHGTGCGTQALRLSRRARCRAPC